MIRKGIIVVLTLAAVGTGVVWACEPAFLRLQAMPSRYASYEENHWRVSVHRPGLNLGYGARSFPGNRSVSQASFAGFHYSHVTTADADYIGLTIPYWELLLLFVVYPAATLTRGVAHKYFRRPLPPEDHCQKCGYNLTGNKSGRCPECGTPT